MFMSWKLASAFGRIDPEIERKLIIDYDRKSTPRPAWVHVKNSDGKIGMIGLDDKNGKRTMYRVYLMTKIPFFLPTDYTSEEMRKFYNKFSEIYDFYTEKKNKPAADLIFKKLKLGKESKLLELGAGTGQTALHFANAGHKIMLTDFSEDMLKIAKQRKELKACRFKVIDVRNLNLSEKFDAIYSIFSFGSNSYFKKEEMPSLYKKLSNILNKSGKLALLSYDFEPPASLFNKVTSGQYDTGDRHLHPWAIWEKK